MFCPVLLTGFPARFVNWCVGKPLHWNHHLPTMCNTIEFMAFSDWQFNIWSEFQTRFPVFKLYLLISLLLLRIVKDFWEENLEQMPSTVTVQVFSLSNHHFHGNCQKVYFVFLSLIANLSDEPLWGYMIITQKHQNLFVSQSLTWNLGQWYSTLFCGGWGGIFSILWAVRYFQKFEESSTALNTSHTTEFSIGTRKWKNWCNEKKRLKNGYFLHLWWWPGYCIGWIFYFCLYSRNARCIRKEFSTNKVLYVCVTIHTQPNHFSVLKDFVSKLQRTRKVPLSEWV